MRADALLAGVLCALAVRDEDAIALLHRHRGLLAALLGSLAAFLVLLSSRGLTAGSPLMVSVGYTLVAPFFAGALLWVVLFPDSVPARLCRFAPLGAAGVVSYFVYLFHTPVLFTLHWLIRGKPPLHDDWNGGAVTLLAVGITFTLAAVSWRWLESPLLRIGRRFSYA
jgi:peptidoglycan/LPS O-acetylase OafA/YrhL